MAAKIKSAKILQRRRAGVEDDGSVNAWHDISVAAKSAGAKKSISGGASRSVEKQICELRCRLAEIADLSATAAVLNWDQATYMPKGGGQARGHQCATLSRLAHEKLVDPALGRLLDGLTGKLDDRPDGDDDVALLTVTRRDFERAVKVPSALVERMSAHRNRGYTAWAEARPANDFDRVAPLLAEGVDLARELARKLGGGQPGGGQHMMDPLIEDAEPGMTVADVRTLFDSLRPSLLHLLSSATATKPADDACLLQHFPEAKQLAFALKIAEHFGFDLTRGRLDRSPHPFCTTFATGDVRITTRVKSNDLGEALYSTLHEAGHAMYEQGVASAFDRTPLAGGASAGVHESQSRLWENIVGRGEHFVQYAYPLLQRQFPEQLKRIPVKAFYRAVNRVEPSLIRTDADELTYNLHVMIRFDIECDLLEGKLDAKDLPEAWNGRYARDLGVTPTNHADGCLQDVHWFSGTIGGAFQSYTIGNILSAQFFQAAVARHPTIPDEIALGKFATLHHWLTENIYRHGRKFEPADLVERSTGGTMSTAPYLHYLTRKYGALNDSR